MFNFKRTSLTLLLSGILYLSITLSQPLIAGSRKEENLQTQPSKPKYGGVYRRGLGNDPATLDPAKITDIYEEVVVQQIFDGLVQYSENLMVIPCIASSWESSRDNLRWVFHLKKGVTFHNGKEVTAEDFVYTFTRIIHPHTSSPAASLLLKIYGATEFIEGKSDRISGLSVDGPYTLKIQLSEPYPTLIAVLAMINFSVVPKEEVERLGNKFGLNPVGTGPFRFNSWDRNSEIILSANENYHEGRPYLDQIIFRIYPGDTIEQMFRDFELVKLEDSFIPVEIRENVLKNEKYNVIRRPSLVIRMLVMNNKVEPFNDKRVRKAFNYAIDKEKISADVGKGRLIPAVGLIPQGMAGYQPDDINYPYSPEKAAQLLREAGYPNGSGLPVIQFWSNVRSKATLAEDEAIKNYLSAVGIKVVFNYETDWPVFKKMLQEGKVPIFKYSWEADVPDPDNILTSLFHSKSLTNRAFYNSPKIDNMILKAQNEPDYRKRINLYSQVHSMIMEDAPVIPLNYHAYERVFQKYVRGFEGKALGDHYFSLKRVWFDYDSTPR